MRTEVSEGLSSTHSGMNRFLWKATFFRKPPIFFQECLDIYRQLIFFRSKKFPFPGESMKDPGIECGFETLSTGVSVFSARAPDFSGFISLDEMWGFESNFLEMSSELWGMKFEWSKWSKWRIGRVTFETRKLRSKWYQHRPQTVQVNQLNQIALSTTLFLVFFLHSILSYFQSKLLFSESILV